MPTLRIDAARVDRRRAARPGGSHRPKLSANDGAADWFPFDDGEDAEDAPPLTATLAKFDVLRVTIDRDPPTP